MNKEFSSLFHPRRKARATDSVADRDRRAFLKLSMAQGIAAPVAIAMFQNPAQAEESKPAPPPASVRKGTLRNTKTDTPNLHASGAIVRDFVDPYLELLRLLREAAEIEHALMLQYLFCAFSLREPYRDLAGYGSATADNMIGVAIQEMQHLAAVNRLLVALGSCPHLDRQDFPYEPDIYPFTFELERLSKSALAKYVYVEAPSEVFDVSLAETDEDKAFINSVIGEHHGIRKPNHIGSLYRSILDMLAEVASRSDSPITSDEVAEWREELIRIMDEGEDDHFNFFRATFEAKHEAFGGKTNAWDLPPTHADYPSYNIPTNPTAYIGHPNQIESIEALLPSWLGNLHYWIALSTLDLGYRTQDHDAVELAMAQMMSAIWPIAEELPQHNSGMPFDPLSMGYALGAGPTQSKRIITNFAQEALNFSTTIQHRLPDRYDTGATEELISHLTN